MSLWSAMVVSIRAHRSGGSWPISSLPARTVVRVDRWSTPGPQILNLGLSAWELACHALLTTVFAAQMLFALSMTARCVPSQTVPSGTQGTTCR